MCTYWWPWLRMSDNFRHCGRKKKNQTTKYFHPAAIFFEKKRIIIFCHELLYYTAVAIFFFCQSKKETEMQQGKCKCDNRTFTFKIPHLFRISENVCNNLFINLTLSKFFMFSKWIKYQRYFCEISVEFFQSHVNPMWCFAPNNSYSLGIWIFFSNAKIVYCCCFH